MLSLYLFNLSDVNFAVVYCNLKAINVLYWESFKNPNLDSTDSK
uniref:Uncharacterized protein n=1 Tax=Anguilla anguilla TaxID=7936 RepID=A0A0E9QD04_ANGAN